MKFIITALTAIAICTMVATAGEGKKGGAEGKKPALTAEQKECMKKMVEKYDANKDGKVDADEAAKIDRADKKKMKEAGVTITRGKKKK